MPNNNGAVDLSSLSAEEQAAVEQMAEQHGEQPEEPKGPHRVLTAFMIIVGLDGNPQVMGFEDPNFELVSQPTGDLVYGAVQTVAKDLAADETARAAAQHTAQLMAAQAQAMMEQQQHAQVAASLGDVRRGPRG